jgi:uncharacterized membrane-anchored protein
MAFTEHPLRRWAVNELHSRRFAPVPDMCEMVQIVLMVAAEQRAGEAEWLATQQSSFAQWALASRHGAGTTISGVQMLWERHTEASSVTLIFPRATPLAERQALLDWAEQWPGEVIRATHVFVVPKVDDVAAQMAEHGLRPDETICCDVNGALRIWSDFGIHPDGYGRLLVQAGKVSEAERGRIIQRLQELGNYRNLALLGLPMVQQYGPELDRLEAKLAEHAKRVARTDQDDDSLLNELAGISAELELIRSETGFRLSATAAYTEIAADRLAALEVQSVANFQSLTDFTERRLIPAARTCLNFGQRLAQLADRISGVMHTLDVRIDSRIKAQNLQLMQSMERSTQLQFRLQTLVEGLSIIAAAYYLVGLFAFVAKGADAIGKGWSAEALVGAATLPVVLFIYLLVRRLRQKVLGDAPAPPPNA